MSYLLFYFIFEFSLFRLCLFVCFRIRIPGSRPRPPGGDSNSNILPYSSTCNANVGKVSRSLCKTLGQDHTIKQLKPTIRQWSPNWRWSHSHGPWFPPLLTADKLWLKVEDWVPPRVTSCTAAARGTQKYMNRIIDTGCPQPSWVKSCKKPSRKVISWRTFSVPTASCQPEQALEELHPTMIEHHELDSW